MTSRSRGIPPIDLSELPRTVVDLLEHIHRRSPKREPYPVLQLPKVLRRPEVLRVAMDRLLVRVVAWSGSAYTRPTTGTSVNCWRRFFEIGFANTLDEALIKNDLIDDVQCQLHVELTIAADVAVTEHLLRMAEAPPADLMLLSIAANHYHVTPKTLREAIHDGRLHDFRPLTASETTPMLVSEAEVAGFWQKRDVVLS